MAKDANLIKNKNEGVNYEHLTFTNAALAIGDGDDDNVSVSVSYGDDDDDATEAYDEPDARCPINNDVARVRVAQRSAASTPIMQMHAPVESPLTAMLQPIVRMIELACGKAQPAICDATVATSIGVRRSGIEISAPTMRLAP